MTFLYHIFVIFNYNRKDRKPMNNSTYYVEVTLDKAKPFTNSQGKSGVAPCYSNRSTNVMNIAGVDVKGANANVWIPGVTSSSSGPSINIWLPVDMDTKDLQPTVYAECTFNQGATAPSVVQCISVEQYNLLPDTTRAIDFKSAAEAHSNQSL